MSKKAQPGEVVVLASPDQELAIVALLSGASGQAAAAAAGVSEFTVSRWRNTDDVFIAELNRRRAELWGGHAEQLRTLVGDALGVLKQSLSSESEPIRIRAALAILRAAAITPAAVPVDTTPAKVDRARRNEAAIDDLVNLLSA
jgi:hypothetical protein